VAESRKATVRDRQIGTRLRTLREAKGLRMAVAAKVTGMSAPTLSRIETGKRRISTEDVAMITTAYGMPVQDRQELIEFVRRGDTGGWWERPLPGVPQEMGLLASYEAEANSITDWSVMLIPGLLQIEAYARAYMLSAGVAPDEADLRWVARRRRQEILGRIDYTAYIYEGALYVPFGGRTAYREQIRHLLGAPDRGVGVRLVRERRPAAVLLHSWHYMTFPSVDPVVNVEVSSGGFYLQDAHVEEYTRQAMMLDEVAVSRAQTRATLQALLKEI
jgi:transcriptional regulator with XRE-family HTH domain